MHRFGDPVVDRVHQVDPVAETGQPLPRDGKRLRVPIETDQLQFGEALEERLRVSAHAERRIHEDCARRLERGREQLHTPLEEHGRVQAIHWSVVVSHGIRCCSWFLIPIHSDLAPGKCVRAANGWESGARC